MNWFKTRVSIFTAIVLVAIGCQHEPVEAPPGMGGNGGGGGGTDTTGPGDDPCDPELIYFQQSVLPLLVSSCAIPGCHDAGTAEDGVILNNYENIMETGDIDPGDLDGSDLYEVITDSDPDDRMPPADEYPPLSDAEIGIIRDWILQGAQNLSCAGDCDTTNVTYALKIEPLISTNCLGCHSGANPQGGIDLNGYGNASSVALFGDMLDAVQHTGTATPMPFGTSQLPQCEIDLIRIWIENGAPE